MEMVMLVQLCYSAVRESRDRSLSKRKSDVEYALEYFGNLKNAKSVKLASVENALINGLAQAMENAH